MPLEHGKPISAKEIESIISSKLDLITFATLCNDIILASAGGNTTSIPSFTGRLDVNDNGIDAEWAIDYPSDDSSSSPLLPPLLRPGWNIFQVKQRDFSVQDRKNIVSNLISKEARAIKHLVEKTKQRPDRYVLFTNVDLTHKTGGQKGRLEASILSDYDQLNEVEVVILGAGELASYLNNLPHLRSAYFGGNVFMTWKKACDEYRNEIPFEASIENMG